MSQFLQDQQAYENEFLAQCFLINSEQHIFSPVETFFIEAQDQQDQERDSFDFCLFQRNEVPVNDFPQENNQGNSRVEEATFQTKRNSKPSKHNMQMGFITQSPKLQKKTYKKKKTICDPQLKPSQYPTKNFLQNSKGAHFQYIQAHIKPQMLQKIELFGQIKRKNGISMQDYRDLYTVVQFEEVFEQMFRTRYLYRSMMLSRSENKSRIDHWRKISVFEQSFRTKVFERIN